MATENPILKRAQTLWQNLSQGEPQIPSRLAIPRDNCDNKDRLKSPLVQDKDYFLVRVNEMYLTYERKWFNLYDPVVMVISEFSYGGEQKSVPFVVGPMLIENQVDKIPLGMIFSDTRVAGVHPFRGDRLTLSVILCRVNRANYARKLLQVVESAAGVLDFATDLIPYTKIAGVILDGIEALMSTNDLSPSMGLRKEFDTNAEDLLPGYYVLIDQEKIKPEDLFVKNNRLYKGKSLDDCEEFRDADYILYSIFGTDRRKDLDELPYYANYKAMIQQAMAANTPSAVTAARAQMVSLALNMRFDPDLTREQYIALRGEYTQELEEELENAKGKSTLSGGGGDPELRDIVGLLDK